MTGTAAQPWNRKQNKNCTIAKTFIVQKHWRIYKCGLKTATLSPSGEDEV